MMKCGLLGHKLTHSYSPEIHRHLGTYPYSLFEMDSEALDVFLTSKDFDGINVTIPYKKAVIPYCDRLTEVAQRLGAVNTIIKNSDGTLTGHNTDYYGFQSMLKHAGLNPQKKKVLVLGSGGASNTVYTVLRELGAKVIVISRQGENNYSNLSAHSDASLIVNTTPVGMYPYNDASPLSLDAFPYLEGVLDLIYNPAKSKLILDAESRNLIAENGLWMLIAQAKESAEWFTGKRIPDTVIESIYKQMQNKMRNIVLIGMPGCGKTTIGQLLADMTGREFIDTDAYLIDTAGYSIADILQRYGENGFRKRETAALSELGKLSGKIIATGGGCVTRQENYKLLHQNGIILWIQRSLDALATEGRPLLRLYSAEEMYALRQPMYEAFADYQFKNTDTPKAVADRIIQALNLEMKL